MKAWAGATKISPRDIAEGTLLPLVTDGDKAEWKQQQKYLHDLLDSCTELFGANSYLVNIRFQNQDIHENKAISKPVF